MVRVTLRAVRVDLQSNTPVLLLQESSAAGDGRTLPIFIGTPEATAIAYALQGVDVPRPLTHDLLVDVIDALGAELERVAVTALEGATFFAELHLRHGGELTVVSARPSDAVALAVRTGSPLFVDDELMDSEAVQMEIEDEEQEEGDEEVVEEFREFLDNIRPEDFSG